MEPLDPPLYNNINAYISYIIILMFNDVSITLVHGGRWKRP